MTRLSHARRSTPHPSTSAKHKKAAERCDRLKRVHDMAMAAMWVGLIAANFDDFELVLIQYRFSVRDRALLRRIGRDVAWTDGWEAKQGYGVGGDEGGGRP